MGKKLQSSLTHTLTFSSILVLLSACGGGSEPANETAASSSPSQPQAVSLQAAQPQAELQASAIPSALDRQWSPIQPIHKDRGWGRSFNPQQFQVSETGDSFLATALTHKTAQGVMAGTDLNVTQYDAQAQAWKSPVAIANVPFPADGGGWIRNIHVMALPQGNMAVFWLVESTNTQTDQIFMSTFSAASRQWSAGKPIFTVGGHRWSVRPAGEGQLLLTWGADTVNKFKASIYSARDGSWTTAQEVQITSPFPYRLFHQDSAAPTGYGVFTLLSRTFYYDPTQRSWTEIPVASDEGVKGLLVDDTGEVYIARTKFLSEGLETQEHHRLSLEKWAGRPLQRVSSVVLAEDRVESQYFSSEVLIARHAQGLDVTWVAGAGHTLRTVQVGLDGRLAGATRSLAVEGNPLWISKQWRALKSDSFHLALVQFRDAIHTDVVRTTSFSPDKGWSTLQDLVIPGSETLPKSRVDSTWFAAPDGSVNAAFLLRDEWSYAKSLHTASFKPGSGWSPVRLLNTDVQSYADTSLLSASNASGAGTLVIKRYGATSPFYGELTVKAAALH